MKKMQKLALAAIIGAAFTAPALAQTTLTYSSWVPPTHHLTVWQQNWAAELEKATNGRIKTQSLPKAPQPHPALSTRCATVWWISPMSPPATRRRATFCR